MRIAELRRLRRSASLRDWISQTELRPKDIILPYFVVGRRGVKKKIASMPGVYHLSVEELLKDIKEARGIRAVLLFGIPEAKDASGSHAYKSDGAVQRAVRAIKKNFKELIVITDVCLCGYTSHGHCGIVRKPNIKYQKSKAQTKIQNVHIDSKETLNVLVRIAVSHAEAGADLVAPSAMMDGQVSAIRGALDEDGFRDVGILGYSAKYASSFYGPFREALDSAPRFGDRRSYQMDYRNSDEALREIKEDIDEGADIVMVKPALAYLDIIYRAKQKFNAPIAAFNVSGEYALVKNEARGDKIREKELALEILTSIKRAGADFIISYFGKEALRWLE